MSTVYLMQGLPGSGKTTAARTLVKTGAGRIRRVSLDDLRAMLDGDGYASAWTQWDPEREKATVRAQARIALATIEDGYDVVVDNTHLHPGQVAELQRILCPLGEVRWQIHSLIDVPLETCLARNAARHGPQRIRDEVIHELHERYLKAAADGWRLTPEWMATAWKDTAR